MEPNLKNTRLLVIDITNYCCSKEFERKEWKLTFKDIRNMIPKLIKFIKDYKDLGGKVIYINNVPWDKEHLPENLKELYKDPKKTFYTQDKTDFSTKFFKVKPSKDDTIITKNTYSAFSNLELDKALKKDNIKYLIITGIVADGCVDATIKEAFSHGYNFIILKDLIESFDGEKRKQIQKHLKEFIWPKMYGDVISSDEFIKKIK